MLLHLMTCKSLLLRNILQDYITGFLFISRVLVITYLQLYLVAESENTIKVIIQIVWTVIQLTATG